MTRAPRQTVLDSHAADARARPDDAKGTDLRVMRESNRMLVLNCVREQGAIARAEIARRTGLSRTTIGNIMEDLLREGFVHESVSQRAVPSGGRRIVPVHFNAGAGHVLGVAMGRNHVTLALADLAAVVVKRTDVPFATNLGPDVCLPELAARLRAFAAEQRVPWGKIIGVGIGMPGPVDSDQRRPDKPPRMPGWDGVDVRGALEADLEKPIYLDNNCNMGAVGESRYGAGRGVSSLLYVKVGTGIGSGLIVGGQIYRGSSGSAGELGHMTVDPHGPPCGCGNRGCLEALVGAPAIVAGANAAGEAAGADAGGGGFADFAEVARAARGGDAACLEALRRAGDDLGIVLAGLVNFFNPALIVVDGSTMRAGELFLDPVRRSVTARSLPAPLQHMRISATALSGSAIALGGVATVLDAAFSTTSSLKMSLT